MRRSRSVEIFNRYNNEHHRMQTPEPVPVQRVGSVQNLSTIASTGYNGDYKYRKPYFLYSTFYNYQPTYPNTYAPFYGYTPGYTRRFWSDSYGLSSSYLTNRYTQNHIYAGLHYWERKYSRPRSYYTGPYVFSSYTYRYRRPSYTSYYYRY